MKEREFEREREYGFDYIKLKSYFNEEKTETKLIKWLIN